MNLKQLFFGLLSALLVLLGAFFYSEFDDLTLLFTGVSALATALAAFGAMYSAKITERASHTWKIQMKTEMELREAKEVRVTLNAWYRHFLSEANSKANMTFYEIDDDIGLWYREPESRISHLNSYVNKLVDLWNDFEKSLDVTDVVCLKRYHRDRLYTIYREHVKACKDLIVILNKGEERAINPYIISAIYNFKDWHNVDLASAIPIYKVEAETFTQDGRSDKYKDDNGSPIYINPFQEINGTWINIGIQIDEKITEIRDSLGA